jgi:opine dehydrogenase
VPTSRLGRLAGVPTPLHDAGIAMFSAIYRRDLAADNDLLPALGLDEMTVQQVRALAQGGWRQRADA